MRLSRLVRFVGAVLLPVALARALTVGPLHTEYRTEPLALDVAQPRFGWQLAAAERAQRQTAYQVRVAATPAALAAGDALLWDSGKVTAADSFGVSYAGPALRSGARYYWSVRVWDAQDRASAWAAPSWWQMGLLQPADWHARWIGASTAAASPLLRREFPLEKKLRRATAHAYAVGWYRLLVNGTELTERVLSPVNSNYPKGLFYDSYDVTALLRRGANTLGLWLAPGYHQSYSKYGYRWDAPLAARLQLQLEFDDGSTAVIGTDETWKWTDSPVLASDIYHGETYDARRELPGWSAAGFDDRSWQPVALRPAPAGPLRACPFPGLAVAAEIRPVKRTEPRPGVFVFDLGQNIAGWVRLQARGPAGTRLVLRHAEDIHPDGTLDDTTNRAARATDTFILGGRGEETYAPRFTYHGFRYVEVTGYPGTPALDALTGLAVHAALEDAGAFRCSDPLVNRLHENFRRSLANNLYGIPTDTPTRDERTPCQMDSLAVEEAAIANFGLSGYYAKWLHDIAGDGGTLPNWTADQVVLPWLLYQHYGDRRIVAQHFDNMKQVVDRFAAAAESSRYWADGFGDWCAPNPGGSYEGSFSEGPLVAMAFFGRSARIVAAAAQLLGHVEEAQRYTALADQLHGDFQRRFYHPDTATYSSGRQVTSVLPLAFDLVPPENRSAVVAALARRIETVDRGHLDTGIFGTRYLFETLIDHGHADLAHRVLTAPGYPGFANQVAQGATTTWEQWTFRGGMQTHDHAMFSGADATFFSRLGGIRPAAPGYREIQLEPALLSALTFVDCSRQTPLGEVACAWHRDGDSVELRATVPVNATARLRLPVRDAAAIRESGQPAARAAGVLALRSSADTTTLTLGSGRYLFRFVPASP
ncbi:family 78 glycoside hydrolase catalytic domain [Oleiharenicola sp. Vm1]|uniref:family 78 glycoside hydrolase catalytic domain n=1 Tax=Oleiharenicola sp. Vm1 TaxID=3398393 RepID=UPI0039F56311